MGPLEVSTHQLQELAQLALVVLGEGLQGGMVVQQRTCGVQLQVSHLC